MKRLLVLLVVGSALGCAGFKDAQGKWSPETIGGVAKALDAVGYEGEVDAYVPGEAKGMWATGLEAGLPGAYLRLHGAIRHDVAGLSARLSRLEAQLEAIQAALNIPTSQPTSAPANETAPTSQPAEPL